jgi:glycosyltransferase involved in cell wall biosynthesis
MRLSIIIPAYKAENYLPQLLECLDKQMVEGVEVIIVDDGSPIPFKTDYPWATVIRQDNAGPGIARNTGLEKMTGEYFTFIDADDLVSDKYLSTILKKIDDEQFDYCYLSWKTMAGGWQCTVQLKDIKDKFPGFNLCVWNRVYKTATFGKHRFNPKKLWSEDADYIYRLNEHGKKSFISDILYYYRSDTPDSWTKRMMNGELDYTRIVYNIREVKSDDKKLLAEIKKEYAENEIVLLTNSNGIPELEHYCMIMNYNTPVKGNILRGDEYSGFMKIEKPFTTQVVVYVSAEHEIGGLETFTYNFCKHMSKYYDIAVLYDAMFDQAQMTRLLEIVPVIKAENKTIICDTVINTRIVKDIPKCVKAKQTIQMSHTCKMDLWGQLHVPQDKDIKVFVSDVAAKSFDEKPGDYKVIHNMTCPVDCHRALILVSATRPTPEKGMKRMLALGQLLDKANIPYIWLYFSYDPIYNSPKSMIHMRPTLDIIPYIKMADYLVQLSDSEAFGYSIIEALEAGTAIITTPLDVLEELGIEEGKYGYVVPFEVNGFDCKKLLNIPQFEFKWDNTKIIKQWRKILGNTKPKHTYKPKEYQKIYIIKQYKDIVLNRILNIGDVIDMTPDRADRVIELGYGRKV